MSRVVAWNPNDKQQFASSGRKLDLVGFDRVFEGEDSRLRIIKETDANDITCLEWHPFEDSSLLSFGTTQGEVSLINWDNDFRTVICAPSNAGRRSCNSVSWNKLSRSRLAASFDNVKSEGCVTVWDFEQERLQRLSHGESVSTLSWLPDNAHLLVLGTAIGWIRVCDMRSGSQQPAISFLAHPAPRPRKIKGIRSDPFNHSVLATFSDGFGDPVRVWDLRRGGPGKTQLVEKFCVHATNLGHRDTTVQDVAWSPSRPNVLAVAATGQKGVHFYSTAAASSGVQQTSSPLRTTATPEPVRSLSWRGLDARNSETYSQSGTVFEVDPSEKELLDRAKSAALWDPFRSDEALVSFPHKIMERTTRPHEAFPGDGFASAFNRLLLGTSSGVMDLEVRDSAALCVSSSGMMADSRGAVVALNSNECAPYPFSISEESVAGCLNNNALVMQHRASASYSLEEAKNIEVLSGEMDHIYSCIHQLTNDLRSSNIDSREEVERDLANFNMLATATMEVFRMWVWADRFEALSNQTNLSLTNCGILDVVQNETKQRDQQNYRMGVHPTLGAEVFLSKSRSLCKKICGWIDILGVEASSSVDEHADNEGVLEVIVTECLDGFERGCAMALWHGNLNLAVSVLRRAMEKFEQSAGPTASSPDYPLSPRSEADDESTEVFSPAPRKYSQDEASEEVNIDWDEEVTAEYMRVVSLVCMCLAGYNHSAQKASVGKTGAAATVSSAWASMCKHVITQLRLHTRRASSYLTACCVFLLSSINEYSTEDEYNTLDESPNDGKAAGPSAVRAGFRSILGDHRMALEDRVAFAVTFLSNAQLVEWLTKLMETSKVTGKLDHIMITGLSGDGLDILQQYIDRYDDLQTVALLVSRIVDNNTVDNPSRPAREWIWLHEYRNLLNRWGLFIHRARLDVELGKRFRARTESAGSKTPKRDGPHSPKGGRGGGVGAAGAPGFKSKPQQFPFSSKGGPAGHHAPHQDRSKRVLYKISPHSDFPHIYLRCSYCGTSLPVDGMQTTKAESLRSQKGVLNCCAGCNKQLPRCYVCQLYMGMVNPYRELNRTMTQKRIHADSLLHASVGSGADKMRKSFSVEDQLTSPPAAVKSDHNVIDFGRWFFFCQHCRHGGHANCIDEWFGGSGGVGEAGDNAKSSRRIVCGVNGCNCNCKARR